MDAWHPLGRVMDAVLNAWHPVGRVVGDVSGSTTLRNGGRRRQWGSGGVRDEIGLALCPAPERKQGSPVVGRDVDRLSQVALLSHEFLLHERMFKNLPLTEGIARIQVKNFLGSYILSSFPPEFSTHCRASGPM